MNYPSDKKLAIFCKKAYETSTVVCGEVEVLVLIFSTYQVIIHRGTEPTSEGGLGDWISNIRHLPPWWDSRTGFVHPGYLKTVRKAIPYIVKQMDKHLPVYVAGHSKGGGEATITAKMLIHLGFNVKRCVGFGAPRSILFLSKKRYKKEIFVNYRNGSDLVTLIPLRIIGYRHPGGKILQIGEEFSKGRISHKSHPVELYIESL